MVGLILLTFVDNHYIQRQDSKFCGVEHDVRPLPLNELFAPQTHVGRGEASQR